MPEALTWSQPQDLQLRRMRAEGASWDQIATELRLSRWSVIERGRKFGVSKGMNEQVASANEPLLPNPGREPLPAGHHVSWGALISQTTLHGQSYPWPPLSHGG